MSSSGSERFGQARDLVKCRIEARECFLEPCRFTIDRCPVAGANRLGQSREWLAFVERVDVPAVDDVAIPARLRRLRLIEQLLLQPDERVVDRARLRGIDRGLQPCACPVVIRWPRPFLWPVQPEVEPRPDRPRRDGARDRRPPILQRCRGTPPSFARSASSETAARSVDASRSTVRPRTRASVWLTLNPGSVCCSTNRRVS